LWLTKQGTKVRIIDKAERPGTTSRALAVQARTLELYRQTDLTEAVLDQGHAVPGLSLWVRGTREARVSLDMVTSGLTAYGPLIFPQDQHEQLLSERLAALGVTVQRQTELLRFTDTGDHVEAVTRGPDGHEETCAVAYLAGCDGARSAVRQSLGTGFPGGTYQQLFYVADVDATGPAVDGELHIDLDEADFLALFPLKGTGRARLIGTVRDERAAHADTLRFEDVSARAITNMKIEVQAVNWFSTYHVHHRVTEHFRQGRIFLLGDAAHIHSPAGGQGMNTGIGDAINLAWKLTAVLTGQAHDSLLDSYESERRAFARTLVSTTDKAFTLATAEGRIADFIRTHLVPLVVPTLFEIGAARTYLFSTVSQIVISYHDSALSIGKAGQVRGGDRLPWVALPEADNFDALRFMVWQVHVYGAATNALRHWCEANGVRLNVFAWRQAYGDAGLTENAMYLLRPDSYVALASESQDTTALRTYFAARSLLPHAVTA
jgi:2-polyprenyl-6-methoxyphenol hydroxylase-like FAD-dependent oxidoreductase